MVIRGHCFGLSLLLLLQLRSDDDVENIFFFSAHLPAVFVVRRVKHLVVHASYLKKEKESKGFELSWYSFRWWYKWVCIFCCQSLDMKNSRFQIYGGCRENTEIFFLNTKWVVLDEKKCDCVNASLRNILRSPSFYSVNCVRNASTKSLSS